MSTDLKTLLEQLNSVVEGVMKSNEISPEFYVEMNQELIQYLFSLSEMKSEHLRAYLITEAERKRTYYQIKNRYLLDGKKVGESEALAEIDIFEQRVAEANAHADYVKVKETHEALNNAITVIAQKIKLLMQEKRYTNN